VIPPLTRLGLQSLWWGQPQRDAANGNSKATRFCLASLISGLLLFGPSSQAHSQYFRELKIDSHLHLILEGDVSLPRFQEPDVGSYYAPFHGAWITSVDHFERKPGALARQRSLYLETGQDEVLDRTVKEDEILRGPFGSVNATKECFYTRPIQNVYSSVSVEFNGNDLEHELPSEVSKPAEDLPALTSLSLVRIFRTSPEYVIVSANYEANGGLGSLNFGEAKDGNPVDGGGTSVYRTPDPQVNESQEKELAPVLTKYGIPTHIDVQEYLLSRRMPLPAVAFAQEKNVMNEFYGFGKFIRQDELKNGAIVATRWLQPSVTEEEKQTLDPLCDARFRQQQALGLPTVE
jgi:hypothetical protein